MAVYNGDKLTHFSVSKTNNKISVWGDLGTSPPQHFGGITPWSQRLWCVFLMRCTVWLLASERLLTKTKTIPDNISSRNDSTGAYSVDDDDVVFECEGCRPTTLL